MFEDSLFGAEILGRICGIDEAGRGALAGELAVAGCAFGIYELSSIV